MPTTVFQRYESRKRLNVLNIVLARNSHTGLSEKGKSVLRHIEELAAVS